MGVRESGDVHPFLRNYLQVSQMLDTARSSTLPTTFPTFLIVDASEATCNKFWISKASHQLHGWKQNMKISGIFPFTSSDLNETNSDFKGVTHIQRTAPPSASSSATTGASEIPLRLLRI